MNTIRLPIDNIGMVDRLRALSEAHVEALASSMSERGQLVPIEVRLDGEEHFLVTGAHRLAAAAHLGWTEIDAVLVEEFDAHELRLREIDENLIRHDLNPLDRAVFLSERKAIYEARHPETKAGVAGGKARQESATDTMSFAADVAQKTGLDARTIQRAVSIATGISRPLRKRLAGTAIATKQSELLALVKLAAAAQEKVVDAVLRADDPAPSVKAAQAEIEGRTETVDTAGKQLAGLQDRWNRAPAKVRKQFLDWLREEGEDL